MQEVARNELLPPGVCQLCEAAPSEGERVVDTGKTFVPGFPSSKAGRVYVCEPCITALGEAVGLEKGTKVADAEARAALAESKLNAVRDYIADVAKNLTAGSLDVVETGAPESIRVAAAAADAVAEKPKRKTAAKSDA